MSLSLSMPTTGHSLERPASSGLFRKQLMRFWTAFEASQTQKARREIVRILQTMNDSTLNQYGYAANDIEKIRNGEFVAPTGK